MRSVCHPVKVHVSDFREGDIELRQQPEQESRINLRLEHQFVGGQDAHDTFATFRGEEVVDVEGRLSEELVRTLVLEGQKGPLYRADRRGSDVAVDLFVQN